MNDSKDPKISKDPKSNHNQEVTKTEGWTFNVTVGTDADGNLKEVRKPVKKSVIQKAKEEREKKRRETLHLASAPRESLTRRQMAEKMEDKINTEDVFHYANPFKRLLAGGLDIVVFMAAVFVARFTLHPIYFLVTMFLSRYRYQLDLSQVEFYYYGQFVVAFIVHFFLFVIGTSFYNRTIGKKVMGLTVRNDERFTLHVTDIFIRETLIKPLSVASIIGLLPVLFTEKKKALHDYLAKTIVIED